MKIDFSNSSVKGSIESAVEAPLRSPTAAMAGEASRWRIVKCPRCRGLLPESPGLRLYKCGGCGTVLQGIYR